MAKKAFEKIMAGLEDAVAYAEDDRLKGKIPEELISVIDLAKKLGTRKQTVFKVLNRLGITSIRQRHSGHKNQEIVYITLQEAEQVADYFKNRKNSSEKINISENTSNVRCVLFTSVGTNA